MIKLDKVEEQSKGGIILATDKESKRQQAGAQYATVVDVGPTAWWDSNLPWAKIGDRVVTVRYAGAQFNYDDEELKRYRIINDDEIIGIVNEQ